MGAEQRQGGGATMAEVVMVIMVNVRCVTRSDLASSHALDTYADRTWLEKASIGWNFWGVWLLSTFLR